MKNTRLALLLIVVIALVAFVIINTVITPDTIKLGLVGPMTGPLAPYGEGVRDGAILAVERVNANGGILGREVELIVLDNQHNEQETINLVNRLIQRDEIVGLIGPVISATSRVAGPVVQRAGIPMITPTATAVEVTQAGDYVFRVCYLDDYQGAAAANYLFEEMGLTRAGILYKLGDAYSEGLRDVFKARFEELGGEVLDVAYNEGDTDFSAQLSSFDSFGAEAVYCPFYYEDAVLVTRQAESQGLDDLIFAGGDGWDAQELLDQAGNAAIGSVFTTHYSVDDERPMVQNYLTDFQERFGRFPIVLAALGYDATALMLDAIERAGSAEPEAIRDAIAATENFEGVTGQSISLDEDGNPIKDITIIRVVERNGAPAFEFVTQVGY